MLDWLNKYTRFSGSRYYPLILAITAFCLMIFGLLPCEVVLIPAIVSAPTRWKKFVVGAALGSAVGAAALASITFYFGLPLIHSIFPALETSKSWLLTYNWISHYGAAALIFIAIIPIAQTPSIAIAGLFDVPFATVLAAFLVGKLIKYTIVAYITIQTKIRLNQSNFFNHRIFNKKFRNTRS